MKFCTNCGEKIISGAKFCFKCGFAIEHRQEHSKNSFTTNTASHNKNNIWRNNALKAAKEYLEGSAFSFKGLVEQLEYEGYNKDDALYAVENCKADWYKQAEIAAKDYLDGSAFSYAGLIEQLEYEGYTNAQATHGANSCTVDWRKQAVKTAKDYLEDSAFSYTGLIEQLEYEGYTNEQATYAANYCSGKIAPDIKQIDFVDFVVKTNVFRCNLNHNIEQIRAKINIMKSNGSIIEQIVSAGYCKECNCYFLLQSDYEQLRNYGVLLCQQITEAAYRKNGLSIMRGDELKPESLLHQSGYNVSSSENLSTEQRREILRQVVNNGLYSISGICSHLDWLIARNKKVTTRDMSAAISKWDEDRSYISSYKIDDRRNVHIKSIKSTNRS